MSNWVNLHVHTVFSMLDGHGQIDDYADRAKELDMSSLAITDHGNIHGWIDFYEECNARGVKPILGIEAYQARKTAEDRDDEERAGAANDELSQSGPYHLTVLARNNEGYKNLIKLSSESFTDGYYVKPRIDFGMIEKYSQGLTVLSGCLNGGVAQALMRGDDAYALEFAGTMQDIIGKENYFIEVMDHTIEEEREVLPKLAEIAKKIGAKVVPTGDCHYVNPEDSRSHDVMVCVATNSTIDEEERFKFVQDEFYLKSYDEMLKRFPAEWLKNTLDVAEMVSVDISRGEMYFPEFEIPTKETPQEFFERNVWEGVRRKFGDNPDQEVIDRVKYEMTIITRLGFPQYFLVVGDIMSRAREEKIRTGWGRGSAAGSMVSYVLGITNLDPLRFGLVFERFLLPEEVDYEPIFEKIS